VKLYSYDKEIKNSTAQFLDTLNEIAVKRRKGQKLQQIKVHAQLGDSSRTYKFLSNPNKTLAVPKLSVTMTGFARDPNRSSGINDHFLEIPDFNSLTDIELTNYYNAFYGTPVNIDFELEIFTIYHEDLDQIMCNIVACCNPSVYVVTLHPKVEEQKFNRPITLQHQVTWDGSFGFKMPSELPRDMDYRFYANTKFTFKTWIFPGEGAFIVGEPNLISKINFFPEIVGGEEDGVWTLSNWHAVPNTMTFTDYAENVVLGLVDKPFYDQLSLSAVLGVSGPTFSGYWSEVSSMVSGDVYGSSINSVSGNPVYLVTENGDLLVFSDAEILNPFVQNTNLSGMIYQYQSTGKIIN